MPVPHLTNDRYYTSIRSFKIFTDFFNQIVLRRLVRELKRFLTGFDEHRNKHGTSKSCLQIWLIKIVCGRTNAFVRTVVLSSVSPALQRSGKDMWSRFAGGGKRHVNMLPAYYSITVKNYFQ